MKNNKVDTIEQNFQKLKSLIDDKFMIKNNIDGFYYTIGSIEAVQKANKKNYFLNSFYNLTDSDILTMTDNAETLTDVKKELFYTYQTEYAAGWYENYLQVLKNI